MAKLVYKDQEKEVPDGERIQDAAEELGVAFGCTSGICGVCKIDIIEGQENLSPKTEQEEDLCVEDNSRLACQCRILKGKVKFDY